MLTGYHAHTLSPLILTTNHTIFIDDETTSDRLCDLGQGLHIVGDRGRIRVTGPKAQSLLQSDIPWSPSNSYLMHETSSFLTFMQLNDVSKFYICSLYNILSIITYMHKHFSMLYMQTMCTVL